MDWQTIVASLAVVVAATWLGRRSWRMISRALAGGRIGDCAHCPRSSESKVTTPLVQLGGMQGRPGTQQQQDRSA